MYSVACYMQFKICLNTTLVFYDVYKICFVTLNSLSGWCNFVPEECNIYMVENTPGVGCMVHSKYILLMDARNNTYTMKW